MNTTQNLPDILLARNFKKRYNQLISNARVGAYHDTISESATPKTDLERDLARFPELADLLSDVKNGRFDERDCTAQFSATWLLLQNLAYAQHGHD